MLRLRQMLKTTAVRLTLVYTLLFGLLAVGVVAYVSYNTGQLILSQVRIAVDEEVTEIARISNRSSLRNLIPLIERRSRTPGANLYLVADNNGRIIAGNVRDLNRDLLGTDGWRDPPFDYRRFDEDDDQGKAIARVFTLPGGLRLLVGRDIGDAERFREIVRRATTLSLVIMVLTGLVLWFFVGRSALKRIDSVSRSSQRIIAGDLSQRLPLSGAGDEFDRLSDSLNLLIARVEKLNKGVVTMSDSIAHDLKTPLTRLRNKAEVALKNPDRDDLTAIIADADGLISTFNALLMISQAESGARTMQFDDVPLAPILSDMCELFEPLAEDAGCVLTLSVNNETNVQCNRELIAQAVTNLIDNALKYGLTSPKPELMLTLDIVKDSAVISVADNGIGIPSQDLETVTERFVRLDSSRTKPGSGLGLSLVKAIADLHSGSLELGNNYPGLKAELRLPLG